MALTRKTLVAVVHGSDAGQGVGVEIYPYDPETAKGARAGELARSWRPQPGELDEPEAVGRRIAALGVADSRGSEGFWTTTSGPNIDLARAMSGEATSSVMDEDYQDQLGEVLVFDAMVDDETNEVDWSSVAPHPSVDPRTVAITEQVVRYDGFVVDPQALGTGAHLLRQTADGEIQPYNRAGQPVTSMTAEEWQAYAAADRGMIPQRGALVVAVDYGVDGTSPRLRAVSADRAFADGEISLPDSRRGEGLPFRSCDLEAIRSAAGDGAGLVRDSTGREIGEIFVIEADHGDPVPGTGSVVFDGLSATGLVGEDPGVRSLDVRGAGRTVSIGAEGGRFAQATVNEAGLQGFSPFLGAAPVASALVAEQAADLVEESVEAGRQGRLSAMLDRRAERKATRTEPSLPRRALAAVKDSTMDLAREHGPVLVEATKAKLRDPEVQAMLKNAAMTAVDVGLAGKGGAAAKVAKAASTATRVNDLVQAAQQQQKPRSGGLSL